MIKKGHDGEKALMMKMMVIMVICDEDNEFCKTQDDGMDNGMMVKLDDYIND